MFILSLCKYIYTVSLFPAPYCRPNRDHPKVLRYLIYTFANVYSSQYCRRFGCDSDPHFLFSKLIKWVQYVYLLVTSIFDATFSIAILIDFP
jgi:hypothetical protein